MNAQTCFWWPVVLLLAVSPAHATTTLARGIVLEAGRDPKAGDYILARVTWSNYAGEDSLCRIEVPPDSVILLDGKLAERAEAMKPGYLVKALLDCNYFEFYSKTGQLASAAPPADPADGCYLLTFEGAVPMAPLLAAMKQTGAATTAPLVLHLDCRKDRIVGAASVAKGRGSRVKGSGAPGMEILSRGAFHAVDASGLAVKNGRLTGTVTVRFYGGTKAKYGPTEAPPQLPAGGVISTATYTLDATVGADGAVSGTYKGTVEKTEVAGKLAGVARERPKAPEAYTVWLRPQFTPSQKTEANFGQGICFLGFKVQGAEVRHDHISGGHCERLGQVESGTARLTDGKLIAEAKLTLNGKPAVKCGLKLDGMAIGDCIFGTCRLTNEAGVVCEGRFRGELLAFDCPATEGWNEIAWRKEVAKLAAERDAKKKAGQPAAPPDKKP